MMVSLSSRRVPVRCMDDETTREEEKDQASRRAADASIVFARRRPSRRHLTTTDFEALGVVLNTALYISYTIVLIAMCLLSLNKKKGSRFEQQVLPFFREKRGRGFRV